MVTGEPPSSDDLVAQVTPLHLAAQFSSAQVVKALIEAGADLEAQDNHGLTPLYLAAQFDQSAAVVRVLIKAGANAAAKDTYGSEPLHTAACYNPTVDVAIALIAAGANVNSFVLRGLEHGTPLHFACLFNPGIVSALLEAGAWVNILNIEKKSPLFLAAWKNNTEAVFVLLAYGADLELGRNPLLDSSISAEMKAFLIQNKST